MDLDSILRSTKRNDGSGFFNEKNAKSTKNSEQDDSDGQTVDELLNLGRQYYCGFGVKQNYAKAVELYSKAAQQGNLDAQMFLCNCYNNGEGIDLNYAEAVKWARMATEHGNPEAEYFLGISYYKGRGVEKNGSEAVRWARLAAEQEYAKAQYLLGVLYFYGEGVEPDFAEAVKWYGKAAEQGYIDAQNALGNCYYEAYGVERNYEKAVLCYRKAAAKGNRFAQFNLAVCSFYGNGVSRDNNKAIKWFKLSSEQGYAYAQFFLGNYYKKYNKLPDAKSSDELLNKSSVQGLTLNTINDKKMQTVVLEIPCNVNITYFSMSCVICKEKGYSSVKVDNGSLTIEATHGALLSMFGEKVKIQVSETGGGTCKVSVELSANSSLAYNLCNDICNEVSKLTQPGEIPMRGGF
jgi:TPR repeat protein